LEFEGKSSKIGGALGEKGGEGMFDMLKKRRWGRHLVQLYFEKKKRVPNLRGRGKVL